MEQKEMGGDTCTGGWDKALEGEVFLLRQEEAERAF